MWRDIHGVGASTIEWLNRKETVEIAKKKYAQKLETVGFLLHKDKKMVVVSATRDGDNEDEDFSDSSMIPTKNVLKIIVLPSPRFSKFEPTL